MSANATERRIKALLDSTDFQAILDLLAQRGYRIIGPTRTEMAVVYDELTKVEQLPIGFTDEQDGGSYRLVEGRKQSFFDYVVGPQSLKKYFHPAEEVLWKADRSKQGFSLTEPEIAFDKLAFIGVRPCELAALAIQDRVLLEGPYANQSYRKRRENSLIIAVNCTRPGGTCFCDSMGTGPKVESGFDLSLTEVIDGKRHFFVIESGSDPGRELLSALPVRDLSAQDSAQADKLLERAKGKMGRKLNTSELKEKLYREFDNLHWEEVAERCLSCGNCTMVCPTCFCVNIEDVTSLDGGTAERWSRWDSCFTVDFSYIHGGSIRSSTMSRYRQWLEHKLAYWQDQFGTFGCVGCGRCITWCPVGIDITAEAQAVTGKG